MPDSLRDQTADNVRLRLRQLARFRFYARRVDGGRRAFAVYLTHWLFFTTGSYPGEQRYWIRVGQWRKSFGGRRPAGQEKP